MEVVNGSDQTIESKRSRPFKLGNVRVLDDCDNCGTSLGESSDVLLGGEDPNCKCCSGSVAIAMSSVLTEQLGAEESDCEWLSFENSSVVKMLLDLEVRDRKERDVVEPGAARGLRVCCGSVEESAISKYSLGG